MTRRGDAIEKRSTKQDVRSGGDSKIDWNITNIIRLIGKRGIMS